MLYKQIFKLLKSLQHIFFFSLLLILHVEAFTQGIKAGETGPGFFYLDLAPDSVIKGIQQQNQQSYSFDVNNDGTNDFIISAMAAGGLGGGGSNVFIDSFNGNQVAVAVKDSCFAGPGHSLAGARTPARLFNYDDSVSYQAVWSDSVAVLSSYAWGAFWEDTAYFAFNCFYGHFDTLTGYIGLRVFAQSDTVYGWVKLKNTTTSSTTVDAFASSQNAFAYTSAYSDKHLLTLFPTPAMQCLNVRVNEPLTGNAVMSISDLTGCVHWRGLLSEQTTVIDISKLRAGLYLLRVRQNTKTETYKFIKF